ncbi:MAG: IS1182 family transposase [Chloroflexi bacterium]|nr:IS1182 family transposase [Chloroflexota bacterium]
MYRSSREFCEERLAEKSIYRLLARECHRLFPDEAFADLFDDVGRESVPPRIVAIVMVLQRIEGLSDREAVERFTFDVRWKYGAGGLDFEHPGFVHTVLVRMRERLRRSTRPNRVFEAVLEVAKQAGLVGRKRVLDSTALYDAVATQDTVTLIRSAIRALLKVVDRKTELRLRAVLKRDDDYVAAGKPTCDWEDEKAREALVDEMARDAYAVLAELDGERLTAPVRDAAELLTTVVGQDLESREDGVFRIARHVAEDRVISTVDPEARHGHKTSARGFDGYKGHIAIDPDSEIITATAVTAGNASDGSAAEAVLDDVLTPSESVSSQATAAQQPAPPERAEVYGDASYGTATLVERLEEAGVEPNVKVQGASPPREGFYSQDDFTIDTAAATVCCPQGVLVVLQPRKDGSGIAEFGAHCMACPGRARCTTSPNGRTVRVHPKHDTLIRHRRRQRDPAWRSRYRGTRPKVERKLAHLMRRRHGGRRARMRGKARIGDDFALLAAAVNLRRLAVLGVRCTSTGWRL